jgi:hypothetical protein
MSALSKREAWFRAVNKANRIAKIVFGGNSKHNTEQARQKFARKIRDNRHACSCPCCRNPRTSKLVKGWERMTMQEKRAAIEKE